MLGVGFDISSLAMPRSSAVTEAAFSPTSLFGGSLGVWFDAKTSPIFTDAAGTVAHTSGQPVGRWGDLSGNGLDASALGGIESRCPTGGTDADGLPFVQGDAVDDCLVTPSFSLGSEKATFAWVMIAGSGVKIFSGIGPQYNSAGSGYFLERSGVTEVEIGGPSYYYRRGGTITPNRTLLVAEVDRAAQTLSTRINGSVVTTSAFGPGGVSGTYGNYPFSLCARRTSDTTTDLPSAAKIYSALAINRHLTAAELGDLETYLMAEYEVTA